MKQKKYIIFTGTIARIGGAQIYVNNKVKYMEDQGYNVQVCSGLLGPINIAGLKKFSNLIIPEINQFPYVLSKKKVVAELDKLCGLISAQEQDEIVLESNTAHMSCWAEMVAKKIHAKHFLFLLDEYFDYDAAYLPFFKYKFSRNELAVIHKDSLEKLFKNEETISDAESYVLTATCNNVVEDVDNPIFDGIKFDNYDYVCCSLGRLNKKYIPNVIKAFREFADKNFNKHILYIFIGSQPEGSEPNMEDVIQKTFAECKNVDILLAGYVYPIPQKLFSHIDVGVASAGSCRVLCKEHVPTITIDADDLEPMGVLGYTTQQTLYREEKCNYMLCEYLEKVLQTDYLDSFECHLPYFENYNEVFPEHVNFINRGVKDNNYYDIMAVKPKEFKNKIKRILILTLGSNCYSIIRNKVHGRR